jgi:glycosyltransferase involved in cell wall biosynthesis
LKLVIVHYHLRPGGVRRIIELGTPHLLRAFKGVIKSVTLAAGEAPDAHWARLFQTQLGTMPVEFFIKPDFGYLTEQNSGVPAPIHMARLRQALARLLAGSGANNCLVWAHNLGLARNLRLTRELAGACADHGIRLIAHHHDWWFDNRWQRWPEMRRAGFRTLQETAEAVFPNLANVFHVAINQADSRILHRHFSRHSEWLPNLADPERPPTPARVRAARAWLRDQLDAEAPVWLMPTRLLRRKNVAEALLLTRWLRPSAWLVTTGSVSSADERAYAQQLAAAASARGWPLRLGILQGDESVKPSVAELLAASETVLLTSIQEGFGLPYVEAAAASRPLIARLLPNIAPDLAKFGFRFPQSYHELMVDPRLFDWSAERRRQIELFRALRNKLPQACKDFVEPPLLVTSLTAPRAIGYGRLTLSAQLEILSQPIERTWDWCAPLNPFLPVWRQRAETGQLQCTPWPRNARQWLSGKAYGERFQTIAQRKVETAVGRNAGLAAQEEFIRKKLGASNLFPLLWAEES